MKNAFRVFFSILAAGYLAGCAMTPDSIVQGPTSARPMPPVASGQANGAIFQSASYRPIFEDRRARFVGDILTMTISEKTSANKAAGNSGSKSGSVETGVTALFGAPASLLGRTNAAASSANDFSEKGATSSSNNFTGTIGVTVVDVLPNGNLVVSGEKQVAFDKGTEFIRVSGVVNPDQIRPGNNILSSQVADARIEYRTNSHVDGAEMMGILTRFFLSVLPL
ncbi:flagellar basal body L-ring protein FlgH [Janthinobacterium sp. 17J80-10]|uniref:flagellar basal body L-ring protein FlgH n=1 Tax=Janthinobacterium sp. 17J80-10 TaxID=2497863 RepID=UPI0010053306|nr:flagellar basal body L-ring protein FlgH [Janthinobacterium sp. 17J80-10]QAU34348.1 flagellar basal body L-ring protein FlgH [Janthinobacterium sp. 17J80-10]